MRRELVPSLHHSPGVQISSSPSEVKPGQLSSLTLLSPLSPSFSPTATPWRPERVPATFCSCARFANLQLQHATAHHRPHKISMAAYNMSKRMSVLRKLPALSKSYLLLASLARRVSTTRPLVLVRWRGDRTLTSTVQVTVTLTLSPRQIDSSRRGH